MAKFIVPKTYKAQVGVEKDGTTPKMGELPYDNAGKTIEVPDEDAEHFEAKGWKRAAKAGEVPDEKTPAQNPNKK